MRQLKGKPVGFRDKPVPAFRTMSDGREICNRTTAGVREYHSRLVAMWMRDEGRCCLCGGMVALKHATFEHKNGRGMGGGKRDDRISVNGVAHLGGNAIKGSRSFESYMQLPLEDRIRNCRINL